MNLLASKVFKKWIGPPLITTVCLMILFFVGLIGSIGVINLLSDALASIAVK